MDKDACLRTRVEMQLRRHSVRLAAAGLALLTLFWPRAAQAAPLQGGGLEIAWWVWLLVIGLFLLISFIIVVLLAWRDPSNKRLDERD